MRAAGVMVLMLILTAASSLAAQEACLPGPRPSSVRAAPLEQIQNLAGQDFDLAYMRVMYQLHADIGTLATQEWQLTSSSDLKELSGKIRRERADMNRKLALWYNQRTGGQLSDYCINSNPDFTRLQATPRMQRDNVYVDMMIGYLQRSGDAAQLAMTRASFPELRNQAKITAKADELEIRALRNWQNNLPMFQ